MSGNTQDFGFRPDMFPLRPGKQRMSSCSGSRDTKRHVALIPVPSGHPAKPLLPLVSDESATDLSEDQGLACHGYFARPFAIDPETKSPTIAEGKIDQLDLQLLPGDMILHNQAVMRSGTGHSPLTSLGPGGSFYPPCTRKFPRARIVRGRYLVR
jgi:hypothetical protein